MSAKYRIVEYPDGLYAAEMSREDLWGEITSIPRSFDLTLTEARLFMIIERGKQQHTGVIAEYDENGTVV